MNNNDMIFAKRLSEIIKFKTCSNTDQSLVDVNEFFKLHNYLEKTYPLVHKTFTKEPIGHAGLIYHYKCDNPTQKPIAFLAHMDVVPEGDVSRWTYPPFSGAIEKGYVWGRGTLDTKCNIIYQMEAMEQLLKEGYKPSHDIYLCYGDNEELMGRPKSTGELIVEKLEEKEVTLGFVLDEGGFVMSGDFFGIKGKDSFAVVSLAEKGYADYEISKTAAGGHSSMPPKSTALGAICRAGANIEANPVEVRITDVVKATTKTLAPYINNDLNELSKDFDNNIDEIKNILSTIPSMNMFISTSLALTMSNGSNRPNVLPGRASLTLNSRILPGDTVESIHSHLQTVVGEECEVTCIGGHSPSPVSPLDSKETNLLKDTISTYFPEAIYVPIIMPGGTDSRFYHRICENVYRFTPISIGPLASTTHTVDERIPVDGLWKSVDFLIDLIKNYSK